MFCAIIIINKESFFPLFAYTFTSPSSPLPFIHQHKIHIGVCVLTAYTEA